jgi:hypothetical protein
MTNNLYACVAINLQLKLDGANVKADLIAKYVTDRILIVLVNVLRVMDI